MTNENSRQQHKWRTILPIIGLVLILVAGGLIWNSRRGYSAEEVAHAALEPDEKVSVEKRDFGWLFDGPGQDHALVFYPGAKVAEEAYAPMLHMLAENGIDVCLAAMPLDLALLNEDKVDDIMGELEYDNWYLGGHSLGGATAAIHAANHDDDLKGIILFAAYPTKKLSDEMVEISIYGSEDGVLNRESYEEGRIYAPKEFYEFVIEGGNHAQFGNYGRQKDDGEATITAEEQQRVAVDYILRSLDIRL